MLVLQKRVGEVEEWYNDKNDDGKKRYLRSDGDVDAENVRSGDVSSGSGISDDGGYNNDNGDHDDNVVMAIMTNDDVDDNVISG